jgi:phosphoribosyl 1,2-cyclic phosphodiesterase
MRIVLWGTRGSLASPGSDTAGYGGNTACVEVHGAPDECVIVLDAGTGIRALGIALSEEERPVHVLLSHLHLDHIQGLGFFAPLFQPGREVHIWGPASTSRDLRQRLSRYLSPPLFPVPLRELPCDLTLHDTPLAEFAIDGYRLRADLICHPGPTVGYRIQRDGRSMAYLSDHEVALGPDLERTSSDWLSGFSLAEGVDLLVHDAQYTEEEYAERVGWGHSSIAHTIAFGRRAAPGKLVTFHHDPSHTDSVLDRLHLEMAAMAGGLEVAPGFEGAVFDL